MSKTESRTAKCTGVRRLWAGLFVATTCVLVLIASSYLSGVRQGRSIQRESGQLQGITLTGATSACPTGGFCIQGSVSGVGPSAPQVLTVSLINPNTYPIFVTTLNVAPLDSGLCPGASSVGIPAWAATDVSPVPTDSIPIGPATSSGPGVNRTTFNVSWRDAGRSVDQTPCLGSNIPLTYSGHAIWYGNCITGNQNGLQVPNGTVACVGSTAKITNGINVKSGGGLVIDPGASVTGGINATGGATEIMFCGASLSGGVKVSKATGPVVIGNGTYCPGNTISNGLTVTNNTGGVTVIGNTVTGGTTVTGNSGPTPSP